MAEIEDSAQKKGNGRKAAESLADNAYYALRNRLMQGLVFPGEAMLEEQISAMLGMSRTPVRTALTRLEAEGLLVSGPDRTLRVPRLDARTLGETFDARATVETAVAALAAAHASAEQIQRLEYLIWNEEMANKNRDDALSGGLDRMFHIYLAEVADNFYFTDFVIRINARVSLFLALSNTLGEAIVPALAEHRLIVEAIKGKKVDEARTAMSRHLTNVLQRIREELYPGECSREPEG